MQHCDPFFKSRNIPFIHFFFYIRDSYLRSSRYAHGGIKLNTLLKSEDYSENY